MEKTEFASTTESFDLGRYDPHVSFVAPLRLNLREELPVPVDPIEVIHNRLASLPFEAVAPAIDQTLIEFAPRQQRRGEPVFDERNPAEKAVYDYLHRVTTAFPPKLPGDPERDLQEEYRASRRNYQYFESFVWLRGMREDQLKTFYNINTWGTIREDEVKAREIPDDETIARQWEILLERLDAEEAWEAFSRKTAIETARVNTHPEPRHQRTETLIAQRIIYDQLQAAHAEQIQERVAILTGNVETLRSIPATASARALWETVLTEEEKAAIVRIREACQNGFKLIKEAQGFTSYQDPAFRSFVDTNSEFGNKWDEQILAPLRSLSKIETILIGERTIPRQTRQALKDEEQPIKGLGMETVIEASKHDLLTGYVVDVATAFLMGDIAKPNPAAAK